MMNNEKSPLKQISNSRSQRLFDVVTASDIDTIVINTNALLTVILNVFKLCIIHHVLRKTIQRLVKLLLFICNRYKIKTQPLL